MKDGRLVQIGTPEDIVTNPSDEYVADFVAGISRLKLVYAHTVMQPVDAWRTEGGGDLEGAPVAPPDVDLDHLVNLACDTDQPTVIVEDGKTIGVVTKKALLRGIQGRARVTDGWENEAMPVRGRRFRVKPDHPRRPNEAVPS